MKLIKDDQQYLLFSELYQRYTEPKAKRKAFSIMESAISVYSKKGWDRSTLDMIARDAGIKRPLIAHYFKNAGELRNESIRYIRLLFQKSVVDEVNRQKSPDRMIESYVDECFRWVEETRKHALVWLSFLESASRNPADRAMNTEATRVGKERIQAIIERGVSVGVFRAQNPAESAKTLQVLVTGAMLVLASEDHLEGAESFKKAIRDRCLAICSA